MASWLTGKEDSVYWLGLVDKKQNLSTNYTLSPPCSHDVPLVLTLNNNNKKLFSFYL